MNSELIREVAAAIVAEQILFNWQFYFLIAAVSLVVHVVGTAVGTYVGKRSETKAMAASLNEILRQLKATTEVAEGVRLQLAKADWMDKEWRTIRRVKLEELLATANQMVDGIPGAFSTEGDVTFAADGERLNLLCTLYFPDLRDVVSKVYVAHKECAIHFMENCSLWRAAYSANDLPATVLIYKSFGESRKPFFLALIEAKAALEKQAAQRMLEIALHQKE